MNVVKPSSKT